jgi:hypothetical protein
MILLGQLLLWMVEHWPPLLAIIGFVIMLRFLDKLADQLSSIRVELRDIGKELRNWRVINEEIKTNTAEVGDVCSAVSAVDNTLSNSLQVLYRIEDKLRPT